MNSAAKPLTVAIAGNPNCGKTTLFNALTGLNYKVANYPGVTVEKKSGRAEFNGVAFRIVDLPGVYSLTGISTDELIATKALLGQLAGEEMPDLVISVVDASNLERNLYLASQIIDLGIPVLVALNMADVAEKRGVTVRKEILARELDVPILSIVASKGRGLDELKRAICSAATSKKSSSRQCGWLPPDSPYRTVALEVGTAAGTIAHDTSPMMLGSLLLSEAIFSSEQSIHELLPPAREKLREQGIDFFTFEPTARYQWLNKLVKRCVVVTSSEKKFLSDKIDTVVTHKVWGTLIFFLIMAGIFQSIFLWATIPMDAIDRLVTSLGGIVGGILPAGKLQSLIVNGIIGGAGSVLVFIPQIAILFFFLGLLEDSGYLSRAAFLMDKIMRRFGLQGRSFIPLLSSFACAIPGVLSTRTIPSFADRMVTILVAPLMSCSARLPVYTLLIAAFIPNTKVLGFLSVQGLMLLAMYLLGILGAIVVSKLLKATMFRGEPAIFVMEMPLFRAPSLWLAIRNAYDRIILFLKSAGTVIVACSVILWFLASFPGHTIQESFASKFGHFIEPVLRPVGFNWEIGVGLLASFAAREVFVSSLATVYNLESGESNVDSLITLLHKKQADGTFSLATALSLMVFYVFACQCMSTLAVVRRETGSWRWCAFMFIYMTAMAYMASWITFNVWRSFFSF